MDSNHRRRRQQIYSLPPLTAREPHHEKGLNNNIIEALVKRL